MKMRRKTRTKKTSLKPLPKGIERSWGMLPLTDPRRQAYEKAMKEVNKPKKTLSQKRAEELRKEWEKRMKEKKK